MANKVNTNNIIDIDFSIIAKQKFRIDGDDNRILELNTSDLSVVTRLSETYPKLEALQEKVSQIGEQANAVSSEDENAMSQLNSLGDGLSEIDKEMRDFIDYIFDSNVCEVCSPQGSMYDPIGGGLRYEHIINTLVDLYSTTISAEMRKTKSAMNSHTAKYTGKKK